MKNQLTVEQQVWLAAWTASISSAKYNPKDEANACLEAFREMFSPKADAAPPVKLLLMESSKKDK